MVLFDASHRGFAGPHRIHGGTAAASPQIAATKHHATKGKDGATPGAVFVMHTT
jgi:hypothetical protein